MPFDGKDFQIDAPLIGADDPIMRILRGAKAFHSDPDNWCQTGARGRDGSGCIIVALVEAASIVCNNEFTALRYVKRALPIDALTIRGVGNNIIDFNEREGRTHDELMALYDRAIVLRASELA